MTPSQTPQVAALTSGDSTLAENRGSWDVWITNLDVQIFPYAAIFRRGYIWLGGIRNHSFLREGLMRNASRQSRRMLCAASTLAAVAISGRAMANSGIQIPLSQYQANQTQATPVTNG